MNVLKRYIELLRLYKNIVRSESKCLGTISDSKEFVIAELIRNTHSMEKGLSIRNPKLGFGHKKQEEMINYLNLLKDDNNPLAIEAVKMAIDSFKAYLLFHKEHNYSDSMIERIKVLVDSYKPAERVAFGGVIELGKQNLSFNRKEIEHFFETRHSIRAFSEKNVEEDILKKALKLAQKAPSACNRQGYRAHILSRELTKKYAMTLGGIGGFADDVNRFILVTGKLSAYRMNEVNQYIVSASMYAAYLTLTLHLYGLGACVVQRPLIWDKNWDKLRMEFDIPKDEQLICLLAVGYMEDQISVPESHRISPELMFHFID